MRLSVEVTHKIGLPNYGSSSSTVSIAADVADDLLNDENRLRQQVSRLQQIARGLVETDLAVVQHNAAEAAAEQPPTATPTRRGRPQPAAEPDNDEDGWPQPVRLKPAPGPAHSSAHNGRPRSGRELYPWAKKQEEAGVTGLLKRIQAYGKGEGFPDRMVDWSAAQTGEVLSQILAAAH